MFVIEQQKIFNKRLLPCPFCGCEMYLEKQLMSDDKTIRCVPKGYHKRGCQLEFSGSCFTGNPTTIDGAIKKWNRRIQK